MSEDIGPSTEVLRELVDSVNDIIYAHDLEGNFLEINSAGVALFDYPREALRRMNVRDVVDPSFLPRAMESIQLKASGQRKTTGPYQILCRTSTGAELWLEVNTRIVGGDKIMGVARDVGARRRYEERLMEMSMTDTLTGLYNSRFFWEILNKQTHLAERYRKGLSLLLLDIDDFKVTNDRHGHLVGDQILEAMGRHLREAVRQVDYACRYGGEELTVILPDTTVSQAVNLAERLRSGLAELSVTVGAEIVSNTVSLGIAEYYFAEGGAAMMRRADSAMYEAKRRGKDATVICMNKRGDRFAVV